MGLAFTAAGGDERRDRLLQPKDPDFLLQRLEFRVAGDEFGFPIHGKRGGEGIGEAELVAGFGKSVSMDWVSDNGCGCALAGAP
jgi:hypothetical protein